MNNLSLFCVLKKINADGGFVAYVEGDSDDAGLSHVAVSNQGLTRPILKYLKQSGPSKLKDGSNFA